MAAPATQSSWSEDVIEAACGRAEEWFRSLTPFEPRVFVGKGEVIGHKFPALLSERDCVINFARFLEQEGVPFDAIHHEVPIFALDVRRRPPGSDEDDTRPAAADD
jgi:hypothetical protein